MSYLKSFFGQTKMEYLGSWVTRDGIKPIIRKIEAINNMKTPTSRKISTKIYGCKKYYQDM